MIKLNNKNITYVALADSNNSVKGVKEIWYADTNNSVKLVYRRKDALIEGEDYEKYHWLVGDGHSYINTLKLIKSDSEVRCVIIPTSDDFTKWKYIYANDPSNIASTFMCVLLKNNSTLHFRHKRGNVTFAINTEYECVHSIDSVKVNNEVLTPVSESEFQESDAPLYLFSAPTISSTSDLLFNGYIKYVILSDELNLIPCKLLKPVPKWLDANGIRRQVGECGMIDLVSGKFYGNVNSVGTFTVENYYERKEWLQGRNGAYIDTNYYPIVGTDVFSVHFYYNGTMRNPDGVEQCIFGCQNGPYGPTTIRAYINGVNYLSVAYCSTSGKYFPSTNVNSNNWELTDLKLDGNNYLFIANGVTYTFSNNDAQIETMPNSIWVFKNLQTYNSNCYFHGDIAYFKITDTSSNIKMNLIPCTLTMDLPASMDANNIARTKGTSGMWDLVSDRFYGNVANSGTFKAVNLAEGVDYEVHQWLVTEIPNGTFMDLPLNTSNFSFKRIFCDMYNVNYFWSKNALYAYHHAQYHNRIWDIKNVTGYWTSSTSTSINSEITISSTSEVLEINGEEVPQVDYPPSIIKFRNANSPAATSVFKTSSITVDGIERYIPVKLLRSIPSKYDANGIARQVGECGMYDTVNDVFYGNVAGSGTFTVSDDN